WIEAQRNLKLPCRLCPETLVKQHPREGPMRTGIFRIKLNRLLCRSHRQSTKGIHRAVHMGPAHPLHEGKPTIGFGVIRIERDGPLEQWDGVDACFKRME